jgi:hypothetical protein
MESIIAKVGTFLRALQRAPESERKKWHMGASAIVMLLVIIGWVISLNFSLTRSTPRTVKAEEGAGGFFTTIGKGFEVLGENFAEEWDALRAEGELLWSGLGAQLTNPTVFSFVREEPPFIISPEEPVPPQTLPIAE